MLPALEAHLETRFAVRNRYEEYRSTVEVQEIRFESDDPPHEDEPEDIDIKEFKPRHGEGGLDGISELLSEAEEQVEEQPSHALAASSIDELLEDSEGTDTSEVSDSVVQEVLDEPSTPAKEPLEFTTEDSEPSEELDEVGQTPSLQTQSGEEEEEVALLASEQPEETSSTEDALAPEESAAQDTSLSDFDKQFIETSPGPDAPIDLGEDSVEDSEPEQDEESVSEEVDEEVDEASPEEPDEEERDEDRSRNASPSRSTRKRSRRPSRRESASSQNPRPRKPRTNSLSSSWRRCPSSETKHPPAPNNRSRTAKRCLATRWRRCKMR